MYFGVVLMCLIIFYSTCDIKRGETGVVGNVAFPFFNNPSKVCAIFYAFALFYDHLMYILCFQDDASLEFQTLFYTGWPMMFRKDLSI